MANSASSNKVVDKDGETGPPEVALYDSFSAKAS